MDGAQHPNLRLQIIEVCLLIIPNQSELTAVFNSFFRVECLFLCLPSVIKGFSQLAATWITGEGSVNERLSALAWPAGSSVMDSLD